MLANLHWASSFYAETSSKYCFYQCILSHAMHHSHCCRPCEVSCCLDCLEDVHCSFNFDPLNFSHTSDEHTTTRHAVTKGKSIYNTDTVVSGTKYSVNYLIVQAGTFSNIVSHHCRLVSNCIWLHIPARCMQLRIYSIFPPSALKSESEKTPFTSNHLKDLYYSVNHFDVYHLHSNV